MAELETIGEGKLRFPKGEAPDQSSELTSGGDGLRK